MKIVRTRPTRKLAALAVAALALLPACIPSGPPGPNPPTGDGDGFARTSASYQRLRAQGYGLSVEYAPPSDLRMSLLRQRLDPVLNGAAYQLDFHTGLDFPGVNSLFHGAFSDAAPTGTITVSIVTAAEMAAIGCPGANVVGCGGVSTASGNRVLSGRIAILDEHIVQASDLVLSTTVMHELGHALNLAHYNSLYGGELQTMHSGGGSHSGDYRSGDKNGLKWMAAGSLEPDAQARAGAPGDGEIVIVHDVLP
ncbi:MAG: hypothetical protein M5U31_10520 [Acidimicrobiia bacterium]|nr:hypothetical protein [Acidimicrobiia bacterium]